MFQQVDNPVGGSLALSALIAALPLLTLFVLLGALRWKAWQAGLASLIVALAVAIFAFGMLSGELAAGHFPGLRIVDATAFVAEHVLPKLDVRRRKASMALHPTCSSTQLGLNDQLTSVAAAVAESVTVPDAWGCCAFAGDRGMVFLPYWVVPCCWGGPRTATKVAAWQLIVTPTA